MLSSRRRPEMQALRALASEVVAEPAPALDWDKVEAGLFDRIQRRAPERAAGAVIRPAEGLRAAFAVALAAAVAVVVASRGGNVSHRGASHGRAGDRIEASGAPALFEEPGFLRFRLAPGSALAVKSHSPGASMSVALLRGTIHADVAPGRDGEAFTVDVAHTRVAVHGTSFDVTRAGDEAIVAVDRGSVAVGPVGRSGGTQGWLVIAPERAAFSLDGARTARWLEASPAPSSPPRLAPAQPNVAAAAREPLPAPARVPSPASRAAPAIEPAPVADFEVPAPVADTDVAARVADTEPEAPEPVALPPEAATAAILWDIRQCYERQLAAARVVFSVHSMLTLTIAADGSVRQGVFWPPLSPTLMACAERALQKTRFVRSKAAWDRAARIDLSPPARGD